MRIGMWGGDVTGAQSLEQLCADIVTAEELGFSSYWLPSISGHDPLIVFAIASAQTSSIEFGTAVVPTYAQHPFALAQSAATTQAVSNGRLVLGVGPSHQRVIEGRLRMSFAAPVANARDTIEILTRLTAGGNVAYDGDEWSVRGALQHPELQPVPVLLAALGPQMLRLAGRLAAGTFTWMTGPVTLGEHTRPIMHSAAQTHGRNPDHLRLIAGAPVAVCDSADAGRIRDHGQAVFDRYGGLPSYRAMLDREGWKTPAQAIIVGDEETVTAEIGRYAAAGVTDFGAVGFATEPEINDRTRTLLASLT